MKDYEDTVKDYMKTIATRRGYRSMSWSYGGEEGYKAGQIPERNRCSVEFAVRVTHNPLLFNITGVHNQCVRGRYGKGKGIFKYFLDELEKVAKKHGGAVKVSGFANMWLAKFMFKTRGYDAIQTKTGKRITPTRLASFYNKVERLGKPSDAETVEGMQTMVYFDTVLGYPDAFKQF